MINKKLLLLCALLSLWGNSLFAQRIPMAATAEDSARWDALIQQKLQRWSQGSTPQAAPGTVGGGLIRPMSGSWPGNDNGIHINRFQYPQRDLNPTELVTKVFLKQENGAACLTSGIISNVKFRGVVCDSLKWDVWGNGYY